MITHSWQAIREDLPCILSMFKSCWFLHTQNEVGPPAADGISVRFMNSNLASNNLRHAQDIKDLVAQVAICSPVNSCCKRECIDEIINTDLEFKGIGIK